MKKGEVMPHIVYKVAWMPVKERKVLFARSRKEDVLFYCVGGKQEIGENDQQTLCREVFEEAAVSIIRSSIRHLHTFEGPCHGYPAGTILKMVCYDAAHCGNLAPSNEVAELAWFTTKDLYRTTALGQTILKWFHEQGLID